jgi:hypothetical protein
VYLDFAKEILVVRVERKSFELCGRSELLVAVLMIGSLLQMLCRVVGKSSKECNSRISGSII